MATYRVRRVPVLEGYGRASGPDSMSWFEPSEIREAISPLFRATVPFFRAVGPASCLLAGVIWCVHIILLQVRPEDGSSSAGFDWDDQIIIASMILYLIGLAGLYLLAPGRWGRLGTVGLVTAGVGLVICIRATLDFDGGTGHVLRLFRIDFVGWWYAQTWPGLLLLSGGLVLAGIASHRQRILPGWVNSLLIGCSLFMHLGYRVMLLLFGVVEDVRYTLFDTGWAIALLAFGLGWTAIGIHLVSDQRVKMGIGPMNMLADKRT